MARKIWLTSLFAFYLLLGFHGNLTAQTVHGKHYNFEKLAFSSYEKGYLNETLPLFFAADDKMSIEKAKELTGTMKKLKADLDKAAANKKSTLAKARAVFALLEKEYLKNYEQYALFSETLETGKYDCLTASILFSYAFDYVGLAYEAHETTFHAYVIVKDGDRKILIETTDPVYGFVVGKYKVLSMQHKYEKESASMGFTHEDKTVTLVQLAGLQYFNLAVYLFNQGNAALAYHKLELAEKLYPAKRNKDLMVICANAMRVK